MANHTAAAHRIDSIAGLGGTQHGDARTAIGHIELVHGIPVLRLTGELDLLTHPTLQRMLRCVVTGSALTVVVDTSGVTFIDCSGLLPLLRAAAELRRRQARLLMLRPSAAVLRLCALTGTSELLDLTRSDTPSRG